MAKDSFFIRASVDINSGGAIQQTPIDLGFAVDALGKSVVRVHNIAVQYGAGFVTSGQSYQAGYELGTQSSANILSLQDKSIFATGQIRGDTTTGGNVTFVTQDDDVAPQQWTNGYLIGVDQLYLRSFSANSQGVISIILECTVETMSQSAAMALSLSQQ
jgi:hypothetical protein